MIYTRGKTCNLTVFAPDSMAFEERLRWYATQINEGFTTQFLYTGSEPMSFGDVAERLEDERKSGDVHFGIELPDGDFIGTTGLHGFRHVYRSAEFRILIADPDYVGKGIGTEATWLCVNYGFERLNLHRIWLGVSSLNVRAVKTYERVGFKPEGILRDELYVRGAYCHALRYGMLRQEWEALKNERAAS